MSAFLHSWTLFGAAYLLTLLAATTLALVGVVAVARRQVFMAAAVAQASVFGHVLVLMISGVTGEWLTSRGVAEATVIGSALAAAAIIMLGRSASAQGSRLDGEERTAWVFILCSAGTVLLVARTSTGIEQLRRMQASSVIGASTIEVTLFAALLTLLLIGFLVKQRPLVLLLTDPVMAAAVGFRTRIWNLVLTATLGLCVGLGVPTTGMLFTLGCLVLPVLIAKQWCGEVRVLLIGSPLIGIVGALVGLWLSHLWNLPPGQVIVVLFCVILSGAVTARLGWEKLAY